MMRKILVGCLALAILGCASDEVVYRPHFDPSQAGGQQPKQTQTAPKPDKRTHSDAALVEKLGDVDVAKYGIPIYPGATLKPDQIFQFRTEIGGGKKIDIVLESFDDVRPIANWYKDEIAATDAVADMDFASLRGVTRTGHPVQITVINDTKQSTISITVDAEVQK